MGPQKERFALVLNPVAPSGKIDQKKLKTVAERPVFDEQGLLCPRHKTVFGFLEVEYFGVDDQAPRRIP